MSYVSRGRIARVMPGLPLGRPTALWGGQCGPEERPPSRGKSTETSLTLESRGAASEFGETAATDYRAEAGDLRRAGKTGHRHRTCGM